MDLDQYLRSDATTLAGLVAAEEVTASDLLALARERADASTRSSTRSCWR